MFRPDPKPIMAAAKVYAREHLAELAADVLEWKATGLLPSGSKLRLLADQFEPVMDHSRLPLAESLVSDAALKVVASPRAQPVAD